MGEGVVKRKLLVAGEDLRVDSPGRQVEGVTAGGPRHQAGEDAGKCRGQGAVDWKGQSLHPAIQPHKTAVQAEGAHCPVFGTWLS